MIAFCPTVFIGEELEARGWTLRDLVNHMPHESVADWQLDLLAMELYMSCAPTEPGCRLGELADKLASAFGVSADLFRNLEAAWIQGRREATR